MIAGFMGVCATLLVGSQIYSSIETSRRIKELDDKLKQTQIAILEAKKIMKDLNIIHDTDYIFRSACLWDIQNLFLHLLNYFMH